MIEVLTILKNETIFKTYFDKIISFCQNSDDDILSKPAYKEYLRLEDSIAISVFEEDNQILGFSTVLHRPIFNNGVRILNRFYKDTAYRFVNKKREVSKETKEMIKQQLEVAKSFNFDFAFMSRESRISPPAFKHYQHYLSFAKWNVEEKRYRVCNGNDDCNQFIIWTPLTSNANFNLIEVKEKEC